VTVASQLAESELGLATASLLFGSLASLLGLKRIGVSGDSYRFDLFLLQRRLET